MIGNEAVYIYLCQVDAFLLWWNDMPSGKVDGGDHYHHEPCEVGNFREISIQKQMLLKLLVFRNRSTSSLIRD